jgi:hypothetical protein
MGRCRGDAIDWNRDLPPSKTESRHDVILSPSKDGRAKIGGAPMPPLDMLRAG